MFYEVVSTLAAIAAIIMIFVFKPIFSKLSVIQKVSLVIVESLTLLPWLFDFVKGFINGFFGH